MDYTTHMLFLSMVKPLIVLVAKLLYTFLLQGEPANALLNVTTLSLAQVATKTNS